MRQDCPLMEVLRRLTTYPADGAGGDGAEDVALLLFPMSTAAHFHARRPGREVR
jgi:hypothetical protein